MNIKKVTVLYNIVNQTRKGNPGDKLADDDNLNALRDISRSLTKLSYETEVYEVNEKTLGLLDNLKTDLIFNLLEGLGDLPNSFSSITTYIESLGIPITGSSSFSGYLTTDKARTKDFLIRNSIPTPDYQLFISPYDKIDGTLKFPLITKPNMSDASIGITQDSVVGNEDELRKQITMIKDEHKDATLAEQYIDGRELDVMGVSFKDDYLIFPVLEGIFSKDEKRKWDICDFKHKWGSKSYCSSEKCPADLPEKVSQNILELTKKIGYLFDIRGYYRIDIRLSDHLVPHVIEVNVNPGIDKKVVQTKLIAQGISYEDFVQMIINTAIYDFEKNQKLQVTSSKNLNLLKS